MSCTRCSASCASSCTWRRSPPFGAIAFTIGKFGFGILASLGQLVASIYLTSILFVLIGFGAIAWLFGLPLLKIIRYFKDELLIAFTATSGEAMIPRSIEKLHRMGCSEETVGWSCRRDSRLIPTAPLST